VARAGTRRRRGGVVLWIWHQQAGANSARSRIIDIKRAQQKQQQLWALRVVSRTVTTVRVRLRRTQ